MPWVYRTPDQFQTDFNRVIDIAVSCPQSFDVSSEDRALQGCNSSAEATLAHGGRARFKAGLPACRLPAQVKSDKSQGVRGTESPDCSYQTLKKTQQLVSVFFGGIA
jgi:hypothetical protein